MGFSGNPRGVGYVAVGTSLLVCVIISYIARLYTRVFLTRSVGSDDIFLGVSVCLSICGLVCNFLQVKHGLGLHAQYLTPAQNDQIVRWQFTEWIIVFISWFFLRSSIMLFVLRLLPPFKRIQARIVFVTMAVNLVITLLGTISYGVSCQPFRANWVHSPAQCYSKGVLSITTQINGALACIIDVVTALIPAFLLWNVQMKPRTKCVLDIMFGLGLVTAALSIGRAVTLTANALEQDSSWNFIPANYFSEVEERLGLVFACGPTLRQLVAYRRRLGTFLPRHARPPPAADFVTMRRRVTLRDVFWYQKPSAIHGTVYEATQSMCRHRRAEDAPAPAKLSDAVETTAHVSMFDKLKTTATNACHGVLRTTRSKPDQPYGGTSPPTTHPPSASSYTHTYPAPAPTSHADTFPRGRPRRHSPHAAFLLGDTAVDDNTTTSSLDPARSHTTDGQTSANDDEEMGPEPGLPLPLPLPLPARIADGCREETVACGIGT